MSGHTESAERRRSMLRTAMGPDIAAALTDPDVIEVMVNPDGVCSGLGALHCGGPGNSGDAFVGMQCRFLNPAVLHNDDI